MRRRLTTRHTTADEIRYGVIGCAGIAPLHGAAVEKTDGATLVGGSDIVAENAEEFTDGWGGEPYTDTTEMIEAGDVDAVSVCTPSGTHPQVSIEAPEDDHSWGDGHVRVVEDFVTSLQEGTEPMVLAREGRKAVDVILAAYTSANLDREVRIDEPDEVAEHT